MSRPCQRPVCPRCRARWVQVGDRTGHCSGCHRTFSSVLAFDAHRQTVDERRACVDPARLMRADGRPRFVTRVDAAGGLVWGEPSGARVPHWASASAVPAAPGVPAPGVPAPRVAHEAHDRAVAP